LGFGAAEEGGRGEEGKGLKGFRVEDEDEAAGKEGRKKEGGSWEEGEPGGAGG